MSKKNTHNLRLIKQDNGYIVPEIAALFGIHKRTVLNWLKNGLKKIDKHKPYMIHGGDLYDFLKKKQQARKNPCKSNQLYCFKCRAPVKPKNKAVTLLYHGFHKFLLQARCECCNTVIHQIGSQKKITQYYKNFEISTKLKEHLTGIQSAVVNAHLKENRNDKKLSPKKSEDQMELF